MRKGNCLASRLALLFALFVLGSLPRYAEADTDVFASWGGRWFVSFSGTGPWKAITPANNVKSSVDKLRFGDFDGNGRTDVFETLPTGNWRVSFNGSGSDFILPPQSNINLSRLAFGDFDGDGKTDVFTTFGGRWRMSSSGTSPWQALNTSRFGFERLRFGDFDGDGKTDVFAVWGGRWQMSSAGTGDWQVLKTSNIGVTRLGFGDFDGDGKTDVFAAWGGKWHISSGGTGDWQEINSSQFGVDRLRFADFDGDGRTDVFTTWGGKWRVSSGGTGAWQVLNTSNIDVTRLGFGNFNGNGPSSDARTHVGLRISRHTTNGLNDADADTIIASMSSVIQTRTGGDDEACMVEFKRMGAITTFTTGTGIVNTKEELQALKRLPGHVKVVNQIMVCADTVSPGILGCAGPGNSQTVVHDGSLTLADEGRLWLHEYGHTRTTLDGGPVPHRNDPDAVMHGSILGNRVNAIECGAFHR